MPAIPDKVFGIPGKVAVLGGGALLGVGVIIMRRRSAAAAAAAGSTDTTGAATDPNAGMTPAGVDPNTYYSDLAQAGTGYFPTGYTGLGVGGVPTSTDSTMLNNPDAYTTLIGSLTDTITSLAGISPPSSRTTLPQPITINIPSGNTPQGSTTAPKPNHVPCVGGSVADARNPKRCYCPPTAKFWDAKTKRCVPNRPKK